MRRLAWTLASLLAAAALPVQAGGGGAPLDAAHQRGLAYLAEQGGDGHYPAGLAPYAVEAAHAAGLDLEAWPAPGRTALDAVAVPPPGAPLLQVVRPAYAAALAGRLHDWRGEDLEARLRAGFDGTQFGDPALLNDDVYALLALLAGGVAAEDPAVTAAFAFLGSHQNGDGGWSYAVGGSSGTDTTAMVLLLAKRPGLDGGVALRDSLQAARSFILANQVAGEGFAETPGGSSNCDSTAWALRVDAGGDSLSTWPYLLGLQQADGGFAYQPGQGANALCTAEAVTLLGDALGGRAAAPDLDARENRIPSAPMGLVVVCLLAAARFRPT